MKAPLDNSSFSLCSTLFFLFLKEFSTKSRFEKVTIKNREKNKTDIDLSLPGTSKLSNSFNCPPVRFFRNSHFLILDLPLSLSLTDEN